MDSFKQPPADSSASTQCAVYTPRPSYLSTTPALPFMVSISESQLPFSVVHQEEPSITEKQEDAAEEQGATAAEEENDKEEVQVPTTADSAYSSGHENTPEQPEAAQQARSTGQITVFISEEDLWKAFDKVGNEMIVTKPGR